MLTLGNFPFTWPLARLDRAKLAVSAAGLLEMDNVEIKQVTELSSELQTAIGGLVRQLSVAALEPTAVELQTIIESPVTELYVAMCGQDIVGMLTLMLVQTVTGLRARIEDVVVSRSFRRRGVAKALSKVAIERATGCAVRTIDLTSSRPDAVQLYQSLGFHKRDTAVMRLPASHSESRGATLEIRNRP